MRIVNCIIFFILISACSPKIGSKIISKQAPLSQSDDVLVLHSNQSFNNDGIDIGIIKAGDNGLSVNCSYEDVIAILTQLARKNGANIIKIINYKSPDVMSSCVRLTAHIYRVADIRKHEVTIPWSANRRLDWNDFKSPTKHTGTDSSIAAQTYCGINYKGIQITTFGRSKIHVSTIFYCDSSWVDLKQKYRLDLLEHKQGHFDLCEIYARKFRERIKNNKLSLNNIDDLDHVFYGIQSEYFKRQNLYDTQTRHGLNRKNQTEWTNEISEELKALNSFEE